MYNTLRGRLDTTDYYNYVAKRLAERFYGQRNEIPIQFHERHEPFTGFDHYLQDDSVASHIQRVVHQEKGALAVERWILEGTKTQAKDIEIQDGQILWALGKTSRQVRGAA